MDELHTIQDSSDGGAVLATFHYRPKLWVILGCGLMGGAGLGVAYARWAESGGFADITLGLASAAFVLLALLLGGMRTFAPQTVVVRERGLELPAGRWRRQGRMLVLRSEVLGIEEVEVSGNPMVTFHHPRGKATLVGSLLDQKSDYEAILAFMQTGVWEGETSRHG